MRNVPTLSICFVLSSMPACGGDDAGGNGSTGADDDSAGGSAPGTSGGVSGVDDGSGGSTAGEGVGSDSGGSSTGAEIPSEPFSFFVTSLAALQDLSGSNDGFGGDLRFGEEGPGAGLRGADLICATIAERSMPGAAAKQWRAFLSATDDGTGNPVDAIDRIGEGPWYDRLGRTFALSKADLLAERPVGIDAAIRDDFPNEDGVPNHQPDPNQGEVDNHDTLTGSNEQGRLYGATATCADWTSTAGADDGRPRVGHSWPRYGGPGGGGGGPGGGDGSMAHWISSLDEAGCAAGVSLIEMGPPDPSMPTVGSGGGYGGFYCFALHP